MQTTSKNYGNRNNEGKKMKLHLQHTTEKDKRFIRQASKLKGMADAYKKGWKEVGKGAFKTTYKKGRIVVKFDSVGIGSNHLQSEVSKYFSLPKHYRKYFARIFGGDSTRIIQRHVPLKPYGGFTKEEREHSDKLTKKFKIWDAYPGHNITAVDGRPVIFDFGNYHK